MIKRLLFVTLLSFFLLLRAGGEAVSGSIHQGWNQLLGSYVRPVMLRSGFSRFGSPMSRYDEK